MRFTYTKPNGDTSYREVLVIAPPSDSYLVIDTSDLDIEDMGIMLDKFSKYEAAKKALLYEYGLQSYIKTFKASRMTNIENDKV